MDEAGLTHIDVGGGWLACPGCVPYVDKRDWTALVRRVVRVGMIDARSPIVRIKLLRTFKYVGEHMTGEPYLEQKSSNPHP